MSYDLKIRNLNQNIKYLFSQFKIFYKKNYIGQQFCNYNYDLNFFLMKYWLTSKKIFLLKGFFYDLVSLLHLDDYNLYINKNYKKYNNLVLTWSDAKLFKDKVIKDKYFNLSLNYKKNIAWLIILDCNIKPFLNKIESYQNSVFVFYKIKKNFFLKIFNIIFLILKNFTLSIIFFNKKYLLQLNFKHQFSMKFLDLVSKKICFENLKIFMPYEGQPFQKNIIKFIKKKNKFTNIVGYLHTFPSLPLHLYKSKSDTPDKLIINSIDQYNFLSKNLNWKKKNLILKKSARFSNKLKLNNGIYLPISIFSDKNLIKKFNKIFNHYFVQYNFSEHEIFEHPSSAKSHKIHNLVRYLKKIIKKTSNRKIKNKKLLMIIGPTSTVIEALKQGYEVIHIVENQELDVYSSFFWKSIRFNIIQNGIIHYIKLKKENFKFKKVNEIIKYF